MKIIPIKILFVAQCLSLFKETFSAKDEAVKVANALNGRTYFAPKEVVAKKQMEKVEKEHVAKVVNDADIADDVDDYEQISSSSIFSSSSDDDQYPSTYSSSESESESGPTCNYNRRSRSKLVPRVDYQGPWCPGQVMASLVPRAMDPIYDWRNPLTCAQFANNFGGVSVLVGELGGPNFCFAGPKVVYSNYTINRSLSINEPIYARTLFTGVEYAVAAGPIIYPRGLVMYISVAKEVAKLPQVCK